METKLSSKGQVVIPLEIRKHKQWEEGVRLEIVETPNGAFIFEMPKNPLKTLCGIAKDIPIHSSDIRKMRMEDEEHDRKKYSG